MAELKRLHGFEVVQAHDIETNISFAHGIPHPFILDKSVLDGDDYLAGDDLDDVGRIVGGTTIYKNNGTDTIHIYTAHKAGCVYFVTNDPSNFIYNSKKDKTDGKRQQLEKILVGMKIVTLPEFEAELVAI